MEPMILKKCQVCAWNSSAGEVEIGGALGFAGQPVAQLMNSRLSERHSLKSKYSE